MVEYRHLIRCGQLVCNAYLQAERVVIHLVNYNRVESEDGSPANESPIPIFDVGVNLRLKKQQ